MARSRRLLGIGAMYGAWTVLHEFRDGRQSFCLCRCRCGTEKNVRRDSLVRGDSVGCHACANRAGRNLRHGENRRSGQTVEHRAWMAMFHRCSPGYKRPEDYFRRGIRVCEEWCGSDGFARFLKHVGRKPGSAYSLDRIDNDRGYEPGNVRWATAEMQANNRRRSIGGALTA